MSATIALIAALLFAAGALYRITPAAPPIVAQLLFATGLVASLAALATWSGTADSRWLVAAVLLAIGAGIATQRARGLAIAALVLALLGAMLMGIATSRPRGMVSAATSVPTD